VRVSRECPWRRRRSWLTPQRTSHGFRPSRRWPALRALPSGGSRGSSCRCARSWAFPPPRHLYTCSPRLRQTDRDRLLCRSRAVFPFTDVVDFLANELACLCRWRFALSLVAPSALDRFSFGHRSSFWMSRRRPCRRTIRTPFAAYGRDSPL